MQKTPRKVTVPVFRELASTGQKLTMLTAYDYLWAGIMDDAGIDSILVGDSLAMVVQGRSTTLPVTLDQMIYHGELVARAVRRALVIVDMPFMSYQVSPKQAVRNAGRIIKETGADAVKLEGGAIQSETIRRRGLAEFAYRRGQSRAINPTHREDRAELDENLERFSVASGKLQPVARHY